MKSGTVLTLMTAMVLTFGITASADELRMRPGESDPAAVGVIQGNAERNGYLAIELEAQHIPPPDQTEWMTSNPEVILECVSCPKLEPISKTQMDWTKTRVR